VEQLVVADNFDAFVENLQEALNQYMAKTVKNG